MTTSSSNRFKITEIADTEETHEITNYLVHEPIDTKLEINESNEGVFDREKLQDQQHNHKSLEYYYENNEYYNEDYVKNGILRGVLISKWPKVGFGFTLSKCVDKNLYFVNDILSYSPASSCLNPGDFIIEIDELNPIEEFSNSIDLDNYLNEHDAIHMLVLNGDDYEKFNNCKNYKQNCEDIVIVSWSQLKEH